MATRGLAPATIRRRLSALRSIVAFARTIGEIDWSLDVKSPRVIPYRDTSGPGAEGWLAMLAKAKASAELGTAKGRRDLALVYLMHDLLLRRGSAVSLDWPAHVDLEGRAVEVLGKGHTQRIRKTLPRRTRDALGASIRERGSWCGPLFVRLDPGASPRRPA